MIAAGALAIAGTSGVNGATGGWTIARTPSSVVAGVTTAISITATNTAGGSSVGCVHLQVPAAFAVVSVGVDSVQPAHSWTTDALGAGPSGSTIVQVHAATEADILKGDGDVLVFHVTVTGTTPGTYTWPAESRDHANCSAGIDTDSITVSITGSATTPTPMPTPTPTPRPTATPRSLATPRPVPAPTATPSVSATQTSTPIVSTPTVTPFPSETATPDPTPNPTSSPTGSTLSPISGVSGSGTGSSRGSSGGAGATDPFVVGGQAGSDELHLGLTATTLASMDGIVWAVPSLVLGVPGLLLLLAIMAQVVAGVSWLPVVRRKLGAFTILPSGSGLSPRRGRAGTTPDRNPDLGEA